MNNHTETPVHTSTKPRLDGLGYYPCKTCYSQWMSTTGYRVAHTIEWYGDLPVLWRVARLANHWRIGRLRIMQEQHHSFEAEALRRLTAEVRAEAQAKAERRRVKIHAAAEKHARLAEAGLYS
jgi:hypothetical protein